MNTITEIFAVVAGVIHVGVFAMESLLFSHPAVQRAFLGKETMTPAVKLFAFNQGFYNLFLALGAIGGVIAGNKPITLFSCASIVGAGLVLLISQPRLWRGALGQIVPAGIALIAAFF